MKIETSLNACYRIYLIKCHYQVGNIETVTFLEVQYELYTEVFLFPEEKKSGLIDCPCK